MKYGHFSTDATEYIITRPDTPRPWINYLTNGQYCAIVSQCAGGYSFVRDCRDERITRWAPENWQTDRPGRYLYVREAGAGRAAKTWSATYQPMREPPDHYEARHGLGYTVITTRYAGIEIKITFFVPEADPCEVWIVEVRNTSRRARTIELTPYVEWLVGDYHEELRYRNIMNLYNRVWYDTDTHAIQAKKTARWQGMNILPFESQAFLASSLPVTGYSTHKERFLGRYNSEERPTAIVDGRWKNTALCSGEDGIGALRHRVSLKAGGSKTFTVIMGQVDQPPQLHALLDTYRDVAQAQQALDQTTALWRERILDNVVVETPDRDLNTLANVWLKYQMYICNLWSRSPSFYHEGAGGRGYRDSCQDAEGLLAINVPHARGKIAKIASLIRRDGTSAPGWSDTRGPASHRPNKDHQIWLTTTVAAYIKETGDVSILHETFPYLHDQWIKGWTKDTNWQGDAQTDGEGSLLEHLEKNLTCTFEDTGAKGLPRIGHADWNDAIDAAGIQHRGESVWLAMALVRSLKLLAELYDLIDEASHAAIQRERADEMTRRINACAWDGQWYLRGFTDDGTPYGSQVNSEGKMYLNAQSWAILGGIPDAGRQQQICKAVDRHLDGPHGYALFAPAYSTFDAKLGRISMFSEGTKENAAVFCHAATFMIVADLMSGRGTVAHAALRKLMPNAQSNYERYKTEPYAYAEYLVGPDNPYRYGEGAFTWITGTAGWSFMAMTEWLLGARRDYAGLLIDPCIPKRWKLCRVRRPFRGAVYEITIRNPRGVESGVAEIRVDGQAIEGTVISPHGDGQVHQVEVLLGKVPARRSPPRTRAAKLETV